MKTTLDRLGRPDAISWVTAVVALVLMVPATFLSSGVDMSGREGEFFLLVVARVAMMLLVFGLGKAALVFFARTIPLPLITVAAFVGAILAGTTTFDFLLQVADFAGQSYLSQRLRTTFPGTLTALILSSLLVTYARDFSRSNADLSLTLEQLQSSKAEAGERILARQAELIAKITDSINAELTRFQGVNQAADSEVMRTLMDDVVRPLSYSLNRDFPVDSDPDAPVPDPTIDWGSVVGGAMSQAPFRWLAFPIVISVISASFLILNYGFSGVLGTLALLGLSMAMMTACGFLWRVVPAGVGTLWRGVLFTLAHIPIVFPATWAVTWLTGFNVMTPVRFWAFFVICVLASWTVTLVSATLRLLKQANSELVTSVEDLKRELIAINNSYRQLHRGISRLLHGPVQEAISASMIRLQAAREEGNTASYAEVIRERIQASLKHLHTPVIPDTDLRRVFSDLEELWSGVVDIEFTITEADMAGIESDRTAAYALAELVREAVSNATRHGKAHRVTISVRVLGSQRAIELIVDNDGVGMTRGATPGIGSQLFDEQTLSWSRKQAGSIVRVKARLPLTAGVPQSV